jgi:hypothetical protein
MDLCDGGFVRLITTLAVEVVPSRTAVVPLTLFSSYFSSLYCRPRDVYRGETMMVAL